MSYQEKRTIVGLVSGIALIVAYCIYAFSKLNAGVILPDDVNFWAGTMLLFIGIGIVAMIIIQIVFHILLAISIAVKEREHDEKKIESTIGATMIEDEMDKLIGLKSSKFGYAFIGFGFIGGLISLYLNLPLYIMLNIMFLSFAVGSIFEGFVSLYYYKKGV